MRSVPARLYRHVLQAVGYKASEGMIQSDGYINVVALRSYSQGIIYLPARSASARVHNSCILCPLAFLVDIICPLAVMASQGDKIQEDVKPGYRMRDDTIGQGATSESSRGVKCFTMPPT